MPNETGLEVIATRCEFPDYASHGCYYQYFDEDHPIPTDWFNFDNFPQETMQLVALTDVQTLLAKKDEQIKTLRSALNAMLTHVGMDEWDSTAEAIRDA